MGCICSKPKDEDELIRKDPLEEVNEIEKDQEKSKNNITESNIKNINDISEEIIPINKKNEKNQVDKDIKYSDYPLKMVELLNKIREDPVAYAEVIEDSIKNVIEVENAAEKSPKIIYKKKVKVALNNGIPVFKEAAEILRKTSPIPPLELKKEICAPLPKTEEEANNPLFLKEQVKILRENQHIDVYFKDLIKIPEVSALLMIVDDSLKKPGKKRQAVLNKDFKYIGINSKFVGKTFIAYFTFSSV